MDAFLALMQIGRPGDWTDRGLPEVISGSNRPAGLREAALDWLVDSHAGAIGENWQLLAWELGEQPYDRAVPDLVIPAAQLHARGRTAPGMTAPAPRARMQTSRVISKDLAGEGLLGRTILITQERANNSAPGASGPWYVAARPDPDVVAARVLQVTLVERSTLHVVRLRMAAGEVGWLPLGHGVIPVDG